MPVHVGQLVAQEFVIDLFGFKDLREDFGDQIYFLDQLRPFSWSQVKQFCRVTFEDDNRPAGKELVVVEIGFRQAQVGNEVV